MQFPVNEAPASSVAKKEQQKRSNFVCDVSEYVASSSKEKSETKLLLTELVHIHKPLFQESFAEGGLDTSVSMTSTVAVSMQSLLQFNGTYARRFASLNCLCAAHCASRFPLWNRSICF